MKKSISSLILLAICFITLDRPHTIHAATLTVTTATDVVDTGDGLLSLREAIAEAQAGDTIDFDPGLSGETIMLLLGQLTIDKDLTIEGLGALLLTVDGNDTGQVFEIKSAALVSISGLTITGGNATTVDGGGISNDGTLTLVDSTVTGNVAADDAGGILNWGTLVMTNSTVSGNMAGDVAGGINNIGSLTMTNSIVNGNMPDGIVNLGVLVMASNTVSNNIGGGILNLINSVAITNSTVSGNTGDGIAIQGGRLTLINSTVSSNMGHGINNYSSAGSADLKNTIIAGNIATDCYDSFEGLTSLGYNLLSASSGCPTDGIGDLTVEPDEVFTTVLGPLQNNGGPTETHALLPGSLAIDAISIEACVDPDGAPITVDQRGLSRPQGPACDIGSYELGISIIEVVIDIKPGSYPNSISLKSKGKVPVAILTTADFDADHVDPDTCVFAGASPVRWNMEDVDHDGNHDMLFHFMTQEVDLTKESTEATMECETFERMLITGTDSVNIVPKEKKNKKKAKNIMARGKKRI